MLDLAISLDTDKRGVTIIETNRGKTLKAPNWPQDSDCHLVSFSGRGKTAKVIWSEDLADDIAAAISALRATGAVNGSPPLWFQRLSQHAAGAHR